MSENYPYNNYNNRGYNIMEYRLTIVYAVCNAGSVTDELTFDAFYEMSDYIEENGKEWDSYHIAVV